MKDMLSMPDMTQSEEDKLLQALNEAKKAIGGNTGLARALNRLGNKPTITSQAISQWKKVPDKRALDVEKVTGVSRHRLRPDVYGDA
ncbi:hypothetical protein MesoLjLc_51670 [Mesorhizobium sp. L-8-10]|uniref:transcriptional regulator n=1 Tax=Mesorhizobium sp. L-8-10 TaxID=2744523 RepID=UPI0019376998|nr:YdaS family helix-turn-helix protein [Mesorhizobium sp. L-8-10]BCH33237.1 hypothetical protein MesoLjLc_51670 [Mesorhizobium sp. L-8-10]